jgi:hypothetical protein
MAFDEIREKLFKTLSGQKNDPSLSKKQGVSQTDMCSFVKGKIEEVRGFSSRVSSEGVWLTNVAYLLGFSDIFYDTGMRQFRPLPAQGAASRTKFSSNRILPSMQNRASRMTKNPPRYDVRPRSTSEEDRDAARLALYLINQVWDQQMVNKKRLEMVNWTQQCGHAYFKTCWDKNLGPKVLHTHPVTGQTEKVPIGDIRIDVVNAFEMFPDPLAKSFEELGWIVQAKVRPISYFHDQYGEKGLLVKPEDVWLTSLQYEYRINNYSSNADGSNSIIKNSAIECSYYEAPTRKHPEGRTIICANGVLLKGDEDDDLAIGEIPFSKFDDITVAGKYYSESVITHMRPIQDQYNRNISQRADWVNKLLTGKYIAARGHGLLPDAFNDLSGEVVEFDPVLNAPAPQALQIPVIPSYAYNEDEMLIGMMDNISGLSEPSQGQVPSAGMPAIGLQYLVEQDMTRIGVMTEQHEFAYANTGRHILKYAEKYYEEPRILRLSGKGLEYTVKEFVGADIKGNNDVIVIKGSTQPTSKVLKRQEIMNLHQAGYLGNPQDPKVLEKVLDMLEYGDIQEAWKDHSLDMGQIKKQIKMIEQGQKPPVSEFDNHPLFLQELNRYRKSDKFDSLSYESQFILLQVMEDHTQEMINLMNPEAGLDPMSQDQFEAQDHEREVRQLEGVPEGVDPQDLIPEVDKSELMAQSMSTGEEN